MAWSSDDISKFEEIADKLTSESHLAQPDSDNGLIPIYSLVNEITEILPQEAILSEAVEAIQDILQPLLDEACLFDASVIEAMRSFALWCGNTIERIKNDEPLLSYLATSDKAEQLSKIQESEPSEEDAPVLSFDETPVSFDDASDAISAEEGDALPVDNDGGEDGFHEIDNPNWPPEQIEIFAKIAQQFSAELLLTEAGNDEGMLPIYALLKDFESDFDSHDVIHEALVPVLGKMDSLLDNATPFDTYAIQILTEFNIWLEAALSEINAGRDPQPFTPNAEAAPPSETVELDIAGPDDGDDGLLAEFAQYDVVQDLNMEENEELLQEFYTEAVDHLGQIESAVLELEQDVTSRDAINSMFRSFHTIKGVAGFLNLIPINRLAHEVESLMDLVRNDKLQVFTGIIDLVLASKDTITKLIEQISTALTSGTLPDEAIPVSAYMAQARWAMEGPEHYAAKTGSKQVAPPSAQEPAPVEEPQAEASPAEVDSPAEQEAPATPAKAAPPTQSEQKAISAAKRKAAENATIRVNTWKLDNLMDMVGELVIVQSQLLESSRQNETIVNDNSVFQSNMSQLSRITKELQHTSMALRMIPIKPTFQKMGRIVRDLGSRCSKKVRFEVSGEDTELDRNVVEEIGDPLVHMIRNALDHGLEATGDERIKAGKDEIGLITLKAYHQGSNIVIELKDDGRGIDPDRVLAKAISNGIVQEGEQLDKEEIYKLVLAPGFSTAEKITDISGRGVGMDVVRKNIEKLRGKIEIDSELGEGSTFKILLPLTMAIVDGLVVKVGDDRFILPTTSVKVALRPDETVLAKVQGNQEILNIRGKVIPLFRLHNHFAIPGAISNPKDATVVVVETGGKPCGLLVDDMVSKQEVVIKSLGGMMQGIPGVSGGAILGDGTIALILDPASLISAA